MSIQQIIRLVFIHSWTQPLFEWINFFSVRMMNYGNALYQNSGEVYVFKKMYKKWLCKKTESHSTPAIFTVLDVGANIGGYAKACLGIIKSFEQKNKYKNLARVNWISFEPVQATYNKCKAELDLLGATVEKLAVSDQVGVSVMNVSNALYIGTNSLSPASQGGANSTQEEVTLTTVDSYCSLHGIAHINFLKIDAEGFDFEVIKGAKNMIQSGKVDIIQFEFGMSDHGYYVKKFFDELPGYDFYRVLPTGLRKISHYTQDLEIVHGINYLCIRRG